MSLTDWLKRLFAPPQRYEYRISASLPMPGRAYEHVHEAGLHETFADEQEARHAMNWDAAMLRPLGFNITYAEVRPEGGFAQYDLSRAIGAPPPGTPFDADPSIANVRAA